MSTTRTLTAGIAVTAAVVTALAFSPVADAVRPQVASSAATTLTTTQLVAMYEEERLSGDVYEDFADRYGARIFTTIGQAEDVHQGAVAALLESTGFDVGTLPTQPGDYRTEGYADLYRDLVAQGSAGLDSAYEVGVVIETRDISDLDQLLSATTDAAQIRVITALRNGSAHHLAAFSGDERGAYAGDGPGMGQMGRLDGSGVCDGTGPNAGQPRQGMGHGRQGPGRGMGAGMGAGMGWAA